MGNARTITINRQKIIENFKKGLGNTSVLEIKNNNGGKIFAKCEWENPTGSIKDRAALNMLEKVINEHSSNNEEMHILEYSGGNLAISLAHLCNLLELKLDLVLSDSTSNSIIQKINQLGANIHLVDKNLGFWGVIEFARKLHEENDKFTFLYQHENSANIEAHRNGTGEEIVEFMKLNNISKIDAWVSVAGTGGSLVGVYKKLSEKLDDFEVHLVMPAEAPYGSENPPSPGKRLAGTGGFGLGRKQSFLKSIEHLIKEQSLCSYEEALSEMKDFYSETGIKIGSSAAGNLKAAKKISEKLGENSTVFTIFPDSGTTEEWETILGEKLNE